MKKKILAMLLVSVLALSVTACGGTGNNANADTNVDVDADVDVDTNVDVDTDVDVDTNVDVDTDVDADVAKSEGELQFTVPEGFTYDAADEAYNSEDGLGNFNYLMTADDGSFALMTKELMESALEESFSDGGNDGIDISMDSWEDVTIDGYDAIRYTMSYTYMEIPISQIQIIIDGTDNYHFITFTEMNNGGYQDTFEEVIESLHFND